MHTEKSLELLLGEGFRRFEIFFNTFSELEPDYIDRLCSMLNDRGAVVSSVHPFLSPFDSFLLFSAYERRFRDGLNIYERLFSAAAKLGSDKLVLHGMRSDFSNIGTGEYMRRFGIMSDLAARYGVLLLQENVRGFASCDHSFLSCMADHFGKDAAFVLDVKQSVMSGNDPSETAAVMGSGLRHVHISDMYGNKCVLPGRGELDLGRLSRTLRETGYDGDIILEVYRNSFGDIPELIEAYKFLEKNFIREEST